MVHYYTEVGDDAEFALVQFTSGYLTWVMFYLSSEHTIVNLDTPYGYAPDKSIKFLESGVEEDKEEIITKVLKARERIRNERELRVMSNGFLLIIHPHFTVIKEREISDFDFKEKYYGLHFRYYKNDFMMKNNAKDMKFPVYKLDTDYWGRSFRRINEIVPENLEGRNYHRNNERANVSDEFISDEIRDIFNVALDDFKIIEMNDNNRIININNNNDNNNNDDIDVMDNNNNGKKSHKCIQM